MEATNIVLKDDYIFKILLIGDSCVGKSNILSRFTKNEFSIVSNPTDGMLFTSQSYHIDDMTIEGRFFDASGQEQHRSFNRNFYGKAMAALIVYDITNHSTFKNVEGWVKEFRENNNGKNVIIMLVGNKSDLDHLRQVSVEEAKSFAEREKILFIETSALNATNVEECRTTILSQINKNFFPNP